MTDRPNGRSMSLRELYHEETDARSYVREGYLYFGLIHAQLALVLLGHLPRWTLPLVLPVLMARMMTGRHELIHVRRESQVDLFTRLWPVLAMVTPLSAGFREYRVLHRRHHQYTLTERDPDLYQIRGSMLSGWFQCFISPERTLVEWIAERGLDRALVIEVALRAAFFSAVAVVSGPTFLWYWIPLRLTYGTALFVFSYVLHRRGERYGVFRIELPIWAFHALVLLFGRAGWLAISNHDLHHQNGNLAPLKLPEARARFEARAAA